MNAVQHLGVSLIDQGDNVRSRLELGEAFIRSIERHGVIQPITVAKVGSHYRCLYGHRRLAASIAAGRLTIPAIVMPMPPNLGVRQLAENIDRRNLSHMDIARALRAELDAEPGLTHVELGRAVGRSGGWVTNKLALLRLDPVLQQKIASGEIVDAHKVLVQRASLNDGRSAPRSEITRAVAEGRSASVVIPIRSSNAVGTPQITIGVDRDEAYIDLVVTDGGGRSIMLSLSPVEARLLGRRLLQAHQAVAS